MRGFRKVEVTHETAPLEGENHEVADVKGSLPPHVREARRLRKRVVIPMKRFAER